MIPIEFMKDALVINKMISDGVVYRKKETTALRLPTEEEIGSVFIIYKADGQSYRDVVSGSVVVARNSHIVIGYDPLYLNPIYNEWLIPVSVVSKNYGPTIFQLLTTDFHEYKKSATTRMIELTKDLFDHLGGTDSLLIKVDWSLEPMVAHVGDYLCDAGYIISNQNFKDYEQV